MEKTFWKTVKQLLKMLNTELPCDTVISSMGVYRREINFHEKMCIKKVAALLNNPEIKTTKMSIN